MAKRKIETEKNNLVVSTDVEGNVVVSSEDAQTNGANEVAKSFVTLIGFSSETLKEFSELQIDESLYDNKNFARAVSREIKLEKAKTGS